MSTLRILSIFTFQLVQMFHLFNTVVHQLGRLGVARLRRCLMKSYLISVIVALVLTIPLAGQDAGSPNSPAPHKLTIPEKGQHIRVAFIITEGAVVIDFAGPWEVFQDVHIPSRGPNMMDEMI